MPKTELELIEDCALVTALSILERLREGVGEADLLDVLRACSRAGIECFAQKTRLTRVAFSDN